MKQLPGRGFAKHWFRPSGVGLLRFGFVIALAAASLGNAAVAYGQGASRSSRNAIRKDKPPISVVPRSTPPPAMPAAVVPAAVVAPPPVAPSAEQAPPKPPAVAWDGKNLTIDAENSTLSDILVAVRVRTGASIDMPPSTARERVFLHLGPAPVRDVLASLLYGTDFDYVIQASDTDEDGLRSVVLTARGKGDDSGASAVEAQKEPGMRLAPGYAAPGKRTFEVAHTADSEAEVTAPAPDESAAAAGAAPAGPESAAGSAPTDSQPAASTPAESADAGSSGGLVNPTIASRPAGSASAESSPSSGSLPQMIQDMQHLFEQRRQIQAQQNQTATPPTH